MNWLYYNLAYLVLGTEPNYLRLPPNTRHNCLLGSSSSCVSNLNVSLAQLSDLSILNSGLCLVLVFPSLGRTKGSQAPLSAAITLVTEA